MRHRTPHRHHQQPRREPVRARRLPRLRQPRRPLPRALRTWTTIFRSKTYSVGFLLVVSSSSERRRAFSLAHILLGGTRGALPSQHWLLPLLLSLFAAPSTDARSDRGKALRVVGHGPKLLAGQHGAAVHPAQQRGLGQHQAGYAALCTARPGAICS